MPQDLSEYMELVNLDYRYKANDVQAILKSRKDDIRREHPQAFNKSVCILRSVYKDRINDLKRLLLEEKAPAQGARMLLIPCKVNESWVGIFLEIEHDGTISRALYLESSSIDDEPDPALQSQIAEVYPGCVLQLADCLREEFLPDHGYTSSGAYVVENLLLAAQHIDYPEAIPGAEEIRALHLQCLHQNNANMYERFVDRQRFNLSKHDDLLMSLVVIKRLTDSVLSGEETSFNDAQMRSALREFYKTVKTDSGELKLLPKNVAAVRSIDSFIRIQENELVENITQELRVVVWNLPNFAQPPTQLFGKLSAGVIAAGGLAEVGSAVLGYYGIGRRIALSAAYQAGSEAGSLTSAMSLTGASARLLVNPYAMVPSLFFGLMHLMHEQCVLEFNAAMNTALVKYQEGIATGSIIKFTEAEQTLRTALGNNQNRGVNDISTFLWAQISSDRYAFACLLLGAIMAKRSDTNVFDMFNEAYSNAKDPSLKRTSLTWMIRTLCVQTNNLKVKGQHLSAEQRKVLATQNINLLLTKYPQVSEECRQLVVQTMGFVLCKVMKGNVTSDDLNRVLNCEELQILRLIPEHGKLYEILFKYLQAVCLMTQAEKDDLGRSEKDELQKQVGVKLQECCELVEQLESLNIAENKKILLQEIANYCRRCMENRDWDYVMAPEAPLVIDSHSAERVVLRM